MIPGEKAATHRVSFRDGGRVLARGLRREGIRYLAERPVYRWVVLDEEHLEHRRAERELVGWIQCSWPATRVERVDELEPTEPRVRRARERVR